MLGGREGGRVGVGVVGAAVEPGIEGRVLQPVPAVKVRGSVSALQLGVSARAAGG